MRDSKMDVKTSKLESSRVVNVKHDKYDVYIGRNALFGNSKWGNRCRIGSDGTRDDVIQVHRNQLWKDIHSGRLSAQKIIDAFHNKTLGCHCKPAACHGDNYIEALEWALHQDGVRINGKSKNSGSAASSRNLVRNFRRIK